MNAHISRHSTLAARTILLVVGTAGALLANAGLAGCSGNNADDSWDNSPASIGGRYIVTIGDADMEAEAFVSRNLGAIDPFSRDNLTVVTLPIQEPNTPFAQHPVSNAALATPACLTVSKDGRYAYVAESRGPAPDAAMTLDDLPPGENLTVVSLRQPLLPETVSKVYVGTAPSSVDVRDAGDLAAVTTGMPGQQLVLVMLSDGVPITDQSGAARVIAWPLLGVPGGDVARPSTAHWQPAQTGAAGLVVTVPDRGEVMFYRVQLDSDEPTLAPWGDPVACGRYVEQGAFTPDGRYFIALDRGAAPDDARQSVGPTPGSLRSIRIGTAIDIDARTVGLREPHELVASAATAPGTVGLAISASGRWIATSSLGRSPENFSADSHRGGSIQLHRFDPSTGSIQTVGEFAVNGVPGGIAFDASDRFVTVTQFRSFDPNAIDGELAFWKMVGSGDTTRLEPLDFFVGLGKGPHSVRIVP